MQSIYSYPLPMLTSADTTPHAGVFNVPIQTDLAGDDALCFAPSHPPAHPCLNPRPPTHLRRRVEHTARHAGVDAPHAAVALCVDAAHLRGVPHHHGPRAQGVKRRTQLHAHVHALVCGSGGGGVRSEAAGISGWIRQLNQTTPRWGGLSLPPPPPNRTSHPPLHLPHPHPHTRTRAEGERAEHSQSLTRSLPKVRFHCTELASPMAGKGGGACEPSGRGAPSIHSAASSLMRCRPYCRWCGSRPPCAKAHCPLTTSTVGFLASSRAMAPPGWYRYQRACRMRRWSPAAMSPSLSPAARADSKNAPAVTYLRGVGGGGDSERGWGAAGGGDEGGAGEGELCIGGQAGQRVQRRSGGASHGRRHLPPAAARPGRAQQRRQRLRQCALLTHHPGHPPKVAGDVEALVVAVEHVDGTALLPRLAVKLPQQQHGACGRRRRR